MFRILHCSSPQAILGCLASSRPVVDYGHEEATSLATDGAPAPNSRTVWLDQQALEDWEVARIGQYETSQFSLREPVDLIVLLRLKVRHDPSPRSTHPHGETKGRIGVGELKDRLRLNFPNLDAKLLTQLTIQR